MISHESVQSAVEPANTFSSDKFQADSGEDDMDLEDLLTRTELYNEDVHMSENDQESSPVRTESSSRQTSVSAHMEAVEHSSQQSSSASSEYDSPSSDEEHTQQKLKGVKALPSELIHNIATLTNSDLDLGRLSLSASFLATELIPDGAGYWRKRFLARYDFPILNAGDEFATAYKIRRFVLRKMNSHSLASGNMKQAEHQLLVLNDMILETYNRHKAHLPPPPTSKNVGAMSSPDSSPWIVEFMRCALFGNQKSKYGQPNVLFDTIQVTLSHLVLNRRSPVLVRLPSSRENYDLTRVYNYNKPCKPLLVRLEDKERPHNPLESKRFPNLRSSPPGPQQRGYKLDIHTVLHIRNFWQRHISDDTQGIGENTYASMAANLVAHNKIPRRWQRPLTEHIPVETNWIGHYSCLQPWPKSRQDLEEGQSCAEDWDHVDPMTLEFETSTTDTEGIFWPPAFSTIPMFERIMPPESAKQSHNVTYIRGIAPFKEFKDKKKPMENSSAEQDEDTLPKWHPFLASRLHGFVHDIPSEAILGRKPRRARFSDPKHDERESIIPGWKHIVAVIYKPTTRQLVSVLEYAQEAYGGASGTEMDFNTADVWNNNAAGEGQGAPSQQTAGGNNDDSAGTYTPPEAATNADNDDGNEGQPTEEQVEVQLRKLLTKRVKSFSDSYSNLLDENLKTSASMPPSAPRGETKSKTELPPLFSAKHIRMLEEDFSPAQYMTWDDGTIDYAYAYEGVITPGGKIMLGRWWRIHGIEGMGPGKEVGPDAIGVEVRSVSLPENVSKTSNTAEDESGGAGKKKSKRRRSKNKGGKRKRRRTKKAKQEVYGNETDDEEEDSTADTDWEAQDQSDQQEQAPEEEIEYEFVTMLNGEESRAQNATKGLERGPFVFWAC
ncbi:hypothetical protein LTR64_008583 [Lithohypha guttulata]|uniref:uncharacterized protein n=1 Tax=Lithohypha guttulata TaxID=1690604 RepID=UPI002DDFDB2E|nr:hypothetical protein LTR51_001650 [Lithohypha guttulata]